jgi:hypothetical protein
VPAPSPAHETFAAIRQTICMSELFLQMLRAIIVMYSAGMDSANIEYSSVRAIPTKVNSKVFSVALQLITLVVHVVRDVNSSSTVAAENKAWLYDFLLHTTPLTNEAVDEADSFGGDSDRTTSQDGERFTACAVCNKDFGLFR